MKSLHVGFVALALVALSGCTQGTPGGPGVSSTPSTPTTTTAQKPVIGDAEETFSLSVPSLSTNLKQGEIKAATISLSRGKNFDEDVTLKFADVPKGVTIDPADPAIKHGDAEVNITFQAADDAALGDFTIKVTGHPTKGTDAKTEFELNVAEK